MPGRFPNDHFISQYSSRVPSHPPESYEVQYHSSCMSSHLPKPQQGYRQPPRNAAYGYDERYMRQGEFDMDHQGYRGYDYRQRSPGPQKQRR